MNRLKLVKFNFDSLPIEYHKEYPFSKYDTFIMLGEIEQMLGHCVIAHSKTGQIYIGYHTSDFVELTEDEV
jgi:hypothetical protein